METKAIENTTLTMYTVNKTDDLDFIESYAVAVYDILAACYKGSKTEIPGSVSDMLSLIDAYKIVIAMDNQIHAVALYQNNNCYRIARNVQLDTETAKLAVNTIIKSDHPEYEGRYHVSAYMNPPYWEKEYNTILMPPVYAIAILDNYTDTILTDNVQTYQIILHLGDIGRDMYDDMDDGTDIVPCSMFAFNQDMVEKLISDYKVDNDEIILVWRKPDVLPDIWQTHSKNKQYAALITAIEYMDNKYTGENRYQQVLPETYTTIQKMIETAKQLVSSGTVSSEEIKILEQYIEYVQANLAYVTLIKPLKIF